MKSTGIVRKVDELGRIVLPIEIRKVMGINEKDAIEIFTDAGNAVMTYGFNAMQQNMYLQREITAARELYNDTVNEWNKDIFAWPTKKIVAAKNGYTTRIPFVASKEIKEKALSYSIAEISEEDEIVLDTTGRKNGRGAYICASMECLKNAQKKRGLERSLKVSIPEDVYESLEQEMREVAK